LDVEIGLWSKELPFSSFGGWVISYSLNKGFNTTYAASGGTNWQLIDLNCSFKQLTSLKLKHHYCRSVPYGQFAVGPI
jgi:hypothetical protein